MKFDVVVGNPPYQENIEHRGEQPSIYHYFYDLAENISNEYCLITPARFLFNVGKTPKKWNLKMLSDVHLKVLYFNQNAVEVFPNTDIKGGISIMYRNSKLILGPINKFTTHEELNTISQKVKKISCESISNLLYSNTSYKYSDNLWKENSNLTSRVSGGSKRYLSSSVFEKLGELFFVEEPNDSLDYVEIFGRENNERISKWMRKDYLKNHPNLEKYKVFVPSSNGSGKLGEALSSPFVANPNQGHTETYISFGAFDNQVNAENLLKYLKTKFARTMLSIIKITQGNKTKEVWSKVPIQDFTEKSDINWSKSISEIDKQLYKKYELEENEITFIEEKVKEME